MKVFWKNKVLKPLLKTWTVCGGLGWSGGELHRQSSPWIHWWARRNPRGDGDAVKSEQAGCDVQVLALIRILRDPGDPDEKFSLLCTTFHLKCRKAQLLFNSTALTVPATVYKYPGRFSEYPSDWCECKSFPSRRNFYLLKTLESV